MRFHNNALIYITEQMKLILVVAVFCFAQIHAKPIDERRSLDSLGGGNILFVSLNVLVVLFN